MSITKLIASDNFIAVNKDLIKIVGLEAAVILGNLASEYSYWEDRDELKDGYFYSTVENIEDKTGLTAYQQRQAINKLEELHILEVKKMGIPAKRYIRIDESQVIRILNNKSLKKFTTGSEKTSQQEVKKLDGNKIRDNKIKKEDKSKKESKKPAAQSFDDILDSVPVIKENSDLRDTFIEYIKMRKLIKYPLTDHALRLNINEAYKIAKGDPVIMQKVVEQSIERSYRGIFPLKEEQKPKPQPTEFVNEFTEILKEEGYA